MSKQGIANALFVKSHLGRDLLQCAALFRNERHVLWEYISNGLQYVDPGTKAEVHVEIDIKNRKLVIRDNGRGMDSDGVGNYFVMHGENVDRAQGRPGRGFFGTGKAAAFAIGDRLVIRTVRGGQRTTVQLKRKDIEACGQDDPIPVEVLEWEQSTVEPNGTTIEVCEIHLKRVDRAAVVKYVEKHLARWPRDCTVVIDGYECKPAEPTAIRTVTFTPSPAHEKVLGQITMTVKVSSAPLTEDMAGVSVFANGVWHETTLAGLERKEMAQYIFGDVDVPALELDTSPIRPFDASRSMKLNTANPTVQALHAFIGAHVEEVRKQLVAEDRKRRRSHEAKRLKKAADEIAKVLNADFTQFHDQVARMKARRRGGTDPGAAAPAGDGNGKLAVGGDDPAVEDAPEGGPKPKATREKTGENKGRTNDSTTKPTSGPILAVPEEEATHKGGPLGDSGKNRRPRGGFDVQFKQMGEDEYRALYERTSRTIFINMDHPQLAAALGTGKVDDPTFRKLSYEVAFNEYAIAIATELAYEDEYSDFIDPISQVQETINRITRSAAVLFAA